MVQTSGSRKGNRQDRQEGEQDDVAGEDDPRETARVHVVEVPLREPDLRQHERGGQERGRGGAAPATHERHERHEPDQELRREDLAERDERAD